MKITFFAVLLFSLSPLARDQKIERDIAPGETHTYEVRLGRGEHARIVVQQQKADVAVRAFAAERLVAEIDSPDSDDSAENLSLIADQQTTYRIEVQSDASNPAAGKYSITATQFRSATDADRKRVTGERAFAEGEKLRAGGGAEGLKKAAAKYEEAVNIWKPLGDNALIGDGYQHVAFCLDLLDDFPKALATYEQALSFREAAGDLRGQAETLTNMGTVYRHMGKPDKSLELYDKALAIRRQIGDRRGEAHTLHSMGSIYWTRSDYRKARELYSQALEIRQSIGDRAGEGESLIGMGMTARAMGDPQKALDYYAKALPLKRAVGDRRGTALVLHNSGVVYSTLGEFRRALDQYAESIEICRAEGNKALESSALTSSGIAYKFLGQYEDALRSFQQSLIVKREIGDKRGQAETLTNLGLLQEILGQPKLALEYYEEALPLYRDYGDRRGEAFTLGNIGSALTRLGDAAKAIESLNQSLEVQRAIGDQNGETETLFSLAIVERDRGDFTKAREYISRSLDIVESLRSRVPVQSLRASYVSLKNDHYRFLVDILMRMHEREPRKGYDVEALIASEQARARSLRELLLEARAGIKTGLDPVLLAQRQHVEQKLSTAERDRVRLLAGKPSDEQRTAADRAVAAALTELQQIESQMRASNPRYASLTQPSPTLEGIQRLLDDNSVLLEYSLGKHRSYVFAVTRRSLLVRTLAKGEEIDEVARKLYELVSSAPRREFEAPLRAAAQQLTDLIIAPVASELKSRRVVVVADGALQYVPFAVLPAGRNGEPLIVAHEVVMLPSASVLTVLREDAGAKPSKTIAVLADPVLRADDPRVTRRTEVASAVASPDAVRAGREVGIDDFERLPNSRQEADAILSFVPTETALRALDFDASRETALDPKLHDFRIIHFATHGLINSKRPELSGIVLSLADQEGRSRDGFLRLNDIYNLDLNADLVVLSACRTALGREMRGEGLVGLSRGFMYAGAPRVVASLWDVRDVTTADFMRLFYERMLKAKRSPAAALREAQISFVRQGRAPFYWAPFVLQGEWQ